MVWTENFRVNSHDCDYNGVVKASAVLRYLQETANLQLVNCGPTPDELYAADKTFVLSKINLSIYRPLHAYEHIRVETWACEGHGASFPRCGRIYVGDALAAELVSVFALIRVSDRQVLRTTDVELRFDTEDKMLELDSPARIRIPSEVKLGLYGEHTVSYGDTDLNFHVNNTNYPDILCNFLPSLKGKRVVGISINFHAEAPLGKTLKVYRSEEEDGSYYFRTVLDDGRINVESIVITDSI